MLNEIRIFFTAIMFYTRIPVPRWVGYSPENLNQSTRYLPAMGWIVGGFGALVYTLVSYILPIDVATVAAMALMVLLTGAFHEDALSDFCDGFGGGYKPEQIMQIMKDSRIGVYGGVGLVFLFLSKYVLLKSFDPVWVPLTLVTAHAVSRVNPVLLIFTANYVADPDTSKSKPVGKKSGYSSLCVAILLGYASLAFFEPWFVPILVSVQIAIFLFYCYYVKRKIGGYTGDVLGALQQFSEIAFYITFLGLLSF